MNELTLKELITSLITSAEHEGRDTVQIPLEKARGILEFFEKTQAMISMTNKLPEILERFDESERESKKKMDDMQGKLEQIRGLDAWPIER